MPPKRRDKPRFYLGREKGKPNWYIRWNEGFTSKKASTGTEDEGEANRQLVEFEKLYTDNERQNNLTVERLLSDYLAYKKEEYTRKKQPARNYRELELALTHIRPFFGYLHAKQITRQLGRKYVTERTLAGRSPATIAKELSILNAAMNYAYHEAVTDRPYTVQLPPPPPPRDKWMTEQQVIKFLGSLTTQHIYVFSMLALHTLARKSAVLELTWDRVDFDRLTIDYNVPGRALTRKRRAFVPINGMLYECLLEARKIATCKYVVEYNGTGMLDIKTAFKTAAKQIGMGWVTPHVIRHTGGTLMAKERVPMWEIAGMMADDIRTVTKHYAKHHPDYLTKASESLEKMYQR